ncbi:MAG: cystathionine gamma-synthase [Acidobacteriota bacterium]
MSLPQTLSPATATPHLDLIVEANEPRPVADGASADPRTAAVRAGVDQDPAFGAVMPPLYLSSNFSFEGFGAQRRYDYTRSGNPTRDLLAEAIADLERGAHAVVTSSGMSAIHLVLQLLEPGSTVVASYDCYGGTHRLLRALERRGQVEVRFADLTSPAARAQALRASVDLVWIETPSNPLLRITDLAAAAREAHALGACVAVDNTFLSPALQRPLDFGADLVVHSTTKYLNGHSDVVGGAVVAKDAALGEELSWWANCLGLPGSPFDSYLTLRGVRTLDARLRIHEENAAAVVDELAAHDAVSKVYYPGLADHPGHAIAARQQSGFGGIVSFELRGGEGAVRAFLKGLKAFTLAESLGGVESLVAHPATMTHAAMEAEARRKAGIGDGLLRLSVGLEGADDLRHDLRAALDRATPAAVRATEVTSCAC